MVSGHRPHRTEKRISRTRMGGGDGGTGPALNEETWVSRDECGRGERNSEVQGSVGKGPLSLHISAGLTSFWVILATDNELLSVYLEKDPMCQALFWNRGC